MDYLTLPEVAARRGVGRSRIFALVKQGRIPAVQIGGRWLVTPADADAWTPLPEGWQPGRPRKTPGKQGRNGGRKKTGKKSK